MHPHKLLAATVLLVGLVPGCSILLPDVSTMPVVHNPFPQLSRVAVLPFFNLSNEPTVDGIQFAEAYFAELQSVPGFEVVPVGVTEQTLIDHRIDLSDPSKVSSELRRLATILDVDAVVVGAVTDFSPYYPPRCGMRIEWYAANPGYHEIPAGYGLPWGTPDEEYIPSDVVFEAEMALAREQMKTQSPEYSASGEPPMMPMVDAMPLAPESGTSRERRIRLEPSSPEGGGLRNPAGPDPESLPPQALPVPGANEYEDPSTGFDIEDDDPEDPIEESLDSTSTPESVSWRSQRRTARKVPMEAAPASDVIATPGATTLMAENNFPAALPPDWPDPRGFIPPGPSPVKPPLVKQDGPIMTHTRIFIGNDPEFTTALAAYFDFRDDERFGGYRAYLQRSDDFIRFCCHLHINEMLSARGGASETRVVHHWSDSR